MPRSTRCVFGCEQFDCLHRFPKPAPSSVERLQQWKAIVGKHIEGKTDNDIYTNYRVCNHHFEQRFFYPYSKRLARTALPTLNLGSPASVQDEYIEAQSTSATVEPVVNDPVVVQNMQQARKQCSQIQLKNKIVTGQAIIRKQDLKIKKLINKIVNIRKKLTDQVHAAKKLSRMKLFAKVLKCQPRASQIFIRMQLTQQRKKSRGRRFDIDEKLMSLSIYKKSPRGYNFLRKLFTLPSKRTLQEVLKKITIKPGLNPAIMMLIKNSTENFNNEQRLCVLMFDEMSLSPSLHYNVALDQIVGFEQFGNEQITNNIADHVLVLMIKGLKVNYKQPICYLFCKSATKAVILKQTLIKVITELNQNGLHVIATVCDQSTTNTKVINELIGETRSKYLRSGKEKRTSSFIIENKEIFPLYDPPHLLKGLRNNLLTKDLRFTQDGIVKTAKWVHLRFLLDLDAGEDEMRMCNKLTETHVQQEKIPKMKVKYAAQVFSQRVSGALRFCAKKNLLPQECADTADLLLLIDQLFDSFNGGSYKQTYKIYKNCLRVNSWHFKLWNRAVPILKSMRFRKEIKKRDGTINICYEQVPSIKNWLHNIDTMKDLWLKLNQKNNITSLLTRTFNQDPVENFFSSVRSHGVRNTNPTCQQFENIYKTLLVNNLTSYHSLGANCEEDANSILKNLDSLLLTQESYPKSAPGTSETMDDGINIESLAGSGAEENILATETKEYVAGYVIKKLKKIVCKSCLQCNNQLCNTTPPQENEYIYSIDVTKKSLYRPSENLLICIKSAIKLIKSALQSNPGQSGKCKMIKSLIENHISFDFLTCVTHKVDLKKYLINFVFKLIIYSWCNNVNRILKGRHLKTDNDVIKIQALKYVQSHKRNK